MGPSAWQGCHPDHPELGDKQDEAMRRPRARSASLHLFFLSFDVI